VLGGLPGQFMSDPAKSAGEQGERPCAGPVGRVTRMRIADRSSGREPARGEAVAVVTDDGAREILRTTTAHKVRGLLVIDGHGTAALGPVGPGVVRVRPRLARNAHRGMRTSRATARDARVGGARSAGEADGSRD